jgi:Ca2+-binding RTX toxin-like protein
VTIQPFTKNTYVTSEDQRWVAPGGISALRDADSITLDRSAFDMVTAFPNGLLPSGIVLGRITATGLYGPYTDAGAGGLDTAVGFLAVTVAVPTGAPATADIAAALYWHGEVVEALLPTGHGLTAAAKVDFAAKFRFV